MSKSRKKETGRNVAALVAQFRNSAGSMKDKRLPRGGASNEIREYLEEYYQEKGEAEENDTTKQ